MEQFLNYALSFQEFPLPGSYHFRFLKSVNGFSVWMDIINLSEQVPIHSGGIFVKVTRIAAPSSSQRFVPTNFTPSSVEQPISQPNKPPKPPVKQQSEKLLKFDDFSNDDSVIAAVKGQCLYCLRQLSMTVDLDRIVDCK